MTTADTAMASTYSTCTEVDSGWAENRTVSSSSAPNSPTEPDPVRDQPQSGGDRDGQDRRCREGGCRQPECRAAKVLRPDFLTGQEKQESEAEQVADLDRAGGPDQPEYLRTHDDAGQHLDYHRRHQPPRDQPGQQRRRESGHRHDQQAPVLDGHKPGSVPPLSLRPYPGVTARARPP
jgi:hypothetical protein